MEELKQLKLYYGSNPAVREKTDKIKIGIEYNLSRITEVPEGAKKAQSILESEKHFRSSNRE